MSINSNLFLFIALPLVVSLAMLVNRFLSKIYIGFLGLSSILIYSYLDSSIWWILLGTCLLNFAFALYNVTLYISVPINLLVLILGKYQFGTGFIPLGISFFILQQISSLVDIRGDDELRKRLKLTNFIAFVCFFPQLIAGPIIRVKDFINQIESKSFSMPLDIRKSLLYIIAGFFKKIVIADSIARHILPFIESANTGQVQENALLLTNLFFTLMVYFDFSGYSDIAIGVGRLFGIKLPLNFNSPLKSQNVRELWRNWHITIHDFIMDYFYKPTVDKLTKVVAVFLSFFLMGLWHGSSFNFILFGLYHALLVTIASFFPMKLPRVLGLLLTFYFFSTASPFFYIETNMHESFKIFFMQFSFESVTGLYSIYGLYLLLLYLFCLLAPNTYNYIDEEKWRIKNQVGEAMLASFMLFLVYIFMNKTVGFFYFAF